MDIILKKIVRKVELKINKLQRILLHSCLDPCFTFNVCTNHLGTCSKFNFIFSSSGKEPTVSISEKIPSNANATVL